MIKTEDVFEDEARYLENLSNQLKERARALRASAKPLPTALDLLVGQLEGLSWATAKSGKCDYARDAPEELVEAVRSAKGGIKGSAHHFTASASELTLFRFKRGPK